jgi:hypothetical protein
MKREILSNKNKALSLNLNKLFYGTIAEIGGGQEVSRAFFQAGGASGTVAKSISAYDKNFSDYLYNSNKSGRYVSEARLKKMLDKEYGELTVLLKGKRENNNLFFAYANTVETINFSKTNQGHGWMGVKFQAFPGKAPNEVVIHFNLLENDNLLQQYTLGVLGVNLIYACYNHYKTPNVFLQTLMDNLDRDRIEINMARMSGPDLDYVDNRLLSVQLVKNNMTHATMFDRDGNVLQPADLLYKKNILAFRGSFRPITFVGFDMLKTSYGLFKKDRKYSKEDTISICEITLNNLLEEGEFDERDFLDRVDILNGMGQNVMISNIREYYKLNQYFNKFKIGELRLVIGAHTLEKVLEQKYYEDLKGGILEAFGYLFSKNTRIYVYPSSAGGVKNLLTSLNIRTDSNIEGLYSYLQKSEKIIDISNANKKYLHISSKEVLQMIKDSKKGWETMLPVYVRDFIKSKKLFQ